ncbi:MAG: glucose-6-phosphate isomerase [Bacteroidetes bacterium HGW-Bacteroidetes-14]|jgi:glucose-6-phosphate isomerase|nr:MAG: glucose-6-phosphate isomerase [Bacteroidetes bacterium HGW-Bacteroidetes-14]
MKHKLEVDYNAARGFLADREVNDAFAKSIKALEVLEGREGRGNEFLGWLDLPSETDETLLSRIEGVARRWQNGIDVVVIIGIGGSYLGSKAALDALTHHFDLYLEKSSSPKIVFAGQNLSEDYLSELMELLSAKSAAAVVISKSGTTIEPAVAFRIIKQHFEEKYGKEESARRIVAVTDESRGALRKLSEMEGYETFIIPDNVGGRFSVLTPVGLIPVAVAGYDIRAMLEGARDMQKRSSEHSENNPAVAYAAIRNALYSSGKKIEIIVNYNPKLQYVAEWWKQLYGESEGKENKGIFPASVNFTSDLHSMGQYIQEGERHIFETVISVEKPNRSLSIANDPKNLDGLNFLSGKSIDECNKMAELGTRIAHVDGGVPNMRIILPEINEYNIGSLFYFFEKACGISAYMLDVNPFDQPGVEDYKVNMFALLGKPGFEEKAKELRARSL